MSPIKKFIDLITGQPESGAQELPLNGYGKLPISSEFLQIGAWQGPARAFQEWMKAGHEQWVTHVTGNHRGQVAPSCLLLNLPETRQATVLACVWHSRDSASPPRSYPFALFAVQRHTGEVPGWDDLTMYAHLWGQVQDVFETTRAEGLRLEDLRNRQLLAKEDYAEDLRAVQQQSGDIAFRPWLEGIAASARVADPLQYLGLLRKLVQGWQNGRTGRGIAVRLPISRTCAYLPQIASWVRWLSTNLPPDRRRVTGLFIPHNVPETEPAIAVVTRPIRVGDFQLVTTNAQDYQDVEDATQGNGQVPPGDLDAWRSRLDTEVETLWDWGEWPMIHRQEATP